jgi:hypothetical protein
MGESNRWSSATRRFWALYPRTERWLHHISLVFREIWDTQASPSPDATPVPSYGCPRSHQRTWAETTGEAHP